ncbi:18S pre-ribosomal assembly protein gar2-like protein [Perilla frutescens var. hirtella]|nr:18S pre-ribosomal assembly protein gar2-like protein [Perilla frutescens var. hirtella]
MLATQLLRVLQTIPSDVNHETRVYDSTAQDMIMKENQNGMNHQDEPFCRLDSQEDDKDSLSSDTSTKDIVQTRPEHDFPVAGRTFIHCNENGSRDSRSSYAAASDLYTDKNVLEYERPELIVCYKEISYHVVKDICMDEGKPANRNFFIDSSKVDQSGHSFPQPLNDDNHCKATGAVDEELSISNGLAATSLENAEFGFASQQGIKKERNGILPSERSLYKDAAMGCNLGELKQEGGAIIGATSKTAMHASNGESFVDRNLPIQEFGTRSFLRSFLNSLDDEEDKVEQLPDQFSSGGVVSEGPAATLTEAGPKEDVRATILCYNSEVETRSITFNFNSPTPVVGGIANEKSELVKEQSDSREVIDQKDAKVDIFSYSRKDQACSVGNSNMKTDDEEDMFAESHILQHKDSGSVVSLRKYDQGESSFSADDFIVHSGPIAFSGSLSLCSDGSATSGRSFAFPILQSEWNNSPVRMTEAERRRFRKHKGWRSGLLCCRF